MKGTVAGRVTRKKSCCFDAPRDCAARSLLGSIEATPAAVLMVTVNTVTHAMRKMRDPSPSPKKMTATVIIAIDGMKRRSSM